MQFEAQPEKRNSLKKRKLEHEKSTMVFLDDSPDYCNSDRSLGTVGTAGRLCRLTLSNETARLSGPLAELTPTDPTRAIFFVVAAAMTASNEKKRTNASVDSSGAARLSVKLAEIQQQSISVVDSCIDIFSCRRLLPFEL